MLTGLSIPLIERTLREQIEIRSLRFAEDAAPFAHYAGRPNDFLEDVVGFRPWGKEDSPTGSDGQREWNDALMSDRAVSIVTNNGTGKTTNLAGLLIYFMCCHRNPRIASIAGTWRQVVDLLWTDVRAMYRESKTKLPTPGPKTYKWELVPGWSASGFSTDKETRYQGLHAHTAVGDENAGPVVAILDEASGIAPFAFSAIDGWLTKGDAYQVMAGNPNHNFGPFFKANQPGSTFKRFRLSAFDCPPWIVSPKWIEKMRKKYGEDSPEWKMRVLGEYVEDPSELLVVPLSFLQGAKDAHPIDHENLHIGWDVSRHGKDWNIATLTKGERVVAVERWQVPDLSHSAQYMISLAQNWGVPAKNIHVDIGMGAGAADRMRESGWAVDLVDFGSSPKGEWKKEIGRYKFANRKAELFWVGRELLRVQRASIPEEYERTWEQLMWLHFKYQTTSDKIVIESKDELKRRGIQESPDFADSWALTFSRAGNGPKMWTMG